MLHTNLVPDIKPQYTLLSLLTTIRFDTDYLVGKLIFIVFVPFFFFNICLFVIFFKNFNMIFMNYYVDILGLLVGVGTERELQVDGKTIKLNVIAIEADGYFSSKV